MLTLSATTDAIEVVLGNAHVTNPLQCVATWRDITSTPSYTPGRTVINTNGTTSVDAVEPPAASTQRVVDSLFVFNNDTIGHKVKVTLDANGTEYRLFTAHLEVGAQLSYVDRIGFRVIDAIGGWSEYETPTQVIDSGSTGWKTIILPEDIANSNAIAQQLAPIPAWTIPLAASRKYMFRIEAMFTAAATTTGLRITANGPSFNNAGQQTLHSFSATSESERTSNGYDAHTVESQCQGTTTGLHRVFFFVNTNTAEEIRWRFASEIAASAITLKAGSTLEYISGA